MEGTGPAISHTRVKRKDIQVSQGSPHSTRSAPPNAGDRVTHTSVRRYIGPGGMVTEKGRHAVILTLHAQHKDFTPETNTGPFGRPVLVGRNMHSTSDYLNLGTLLAAAGPTSHTLLWSSSFHRPSDPPLRVVWWLWLVRPRLIRHPQQQRQQQQPSISPQGEREHARAHTICRGQNRTRCT